ncbi:uncharacterized protein LOC143275073 isoform X2 [Babylonia areolata]|uniref:uncharacterized protein LOC143275073 isoform X2 n=1 Tax=Babylonia areolata TaxID=304850 RepID=UPI003FD5AFBC
MEKRGDENPEADGKNTHVQQDEVGGRQGFVQKKAGNSGVDCSGESHTNPDKKAEGRNQQARSEDDNSITDSIATHSDSAGVELEDRDKHGKHREEFPGVRADEVKNPVPVELCGSDCPQDSHVMDTVGQTEGDTHTEEENRRGSGEKLRAAICAENPEDEMKEKNENGDSCEENAVGGGLSTGKEKGSGSEDSLCGVKGAHCGMGEVRCGDEGTHCENEGTDCANEDTLYEPDTNDDDNDNGQPSLCVSSDHSPSGPSPSSPPHSPQDPEHPHYQSQSDTVPLCHHVCPDRLPSSTSSSQDEPLPSPDYAQPEVSSDCGRHGPHRSDVSLDSIQADSPRDQGEVIQPSDPPCPVHSQPGPGSCHLASQVRPGHSADQADNEGNSTHSEKDRGGRADDQNTNTVPEGRQPDGQCQCTGHTTGCSSSRTVAEGLPRTAEAAQSSSVDPVQEHDVSVHHQETASSAVVVKPTCCSAITDPAISGQTPDENLTLSSGEVTPAVPGVHDTASSQEGEQRQGESPVLSQAEKVLGENSNSKHQSQNGDCPACRTATVASCSHRPVHGDGIPASESCVVQGAASNIATTKSIPNDSFGRENNSLFSEPSVDKDTCPTTQSKQRSDTCLKNTDSAAWTEAGEEPPVQETSRAGVGPAEGQFLPTELPSPQNDEDQSRVKTKSPESSSVTKAVETWSESVTTTRSSEVNSTSSEINSTSSEISNTSSEICKASSEISSTSSEINSTSSEISNTSSEICKASSEISNTSSEICKASSEISNTSSEISKASSEIYNMSSDSCKTSSGFEDVGSSVDPELSTTEGGGGVRCHVGRQDKRGSSESSENEFEDVVSTLTEELEGRGGRGKEGAHEKERRDRVVSEGEDASDDDDFFDAFDDQSERSEEETVLHRDEEHVHRRAMDGVDSDDRPTDSESQSSVKENSATEKNNASRDNEQHQGNGNGNGDDRFPTTTTAATESGSLQATSRGRPRRARIPDKPNVSLNLWNVLKNCMGKELSKIPMPVNFNEPLSMLQRLTEELEYTEVLDRAAGCEDPAEQMALVAAFTVSAYATTQFRTAKPFNPLLGETFEFDRTEDLGWRSLAEQVSHHPPTLATHTEGDGWTLWQEFTMTIKFRGRYIQIVPMGMAHLKFTDTGHHYTWRKVTTTVHNIIVGRLWVDNDGLMDITNHATGHVCQLRYHPYSYFSREPHRKVSGVVKDRRDRARWTLNGTWCSQIEAAPILQEAEEEEEGEERKEDEEDEEEEEAPSSCLGGSGKSSSSSSSSSNRNRGEPYRTGPGQVLWIVRPPPEGADKIYHFTRMAIEMNEPEDGVAPTDSRRRPDQRKMEEGDWEEANRLKFLLEEKQREARRRREAEAERARGEGVEVSGYQPAWFRKEEDPVTGSPLHVFAGDYWRCKETQQWDRCPDIFL